MKKLILSIATLFSLSVLAQEHANAVKDGGISFEHGTWAEALAKAKKENKMVMLDAYASWCGPCKWMAKNIFPQKEVGDFYNKNFVSIKIDMEKGEGIELSKKYEVNAYPTFIYVDANGTMIHRSCGGMEAPDFVQTGKDAMDPAKQIASLQKNFTAKPKDSEMALTYFAAAENGCMKIEEDVKKYLDNLKPEQLLEKGNYAMIEKFIDDYSHSSIQYILANYDKFTSAFGKKEVDEKILSVFRGAVLGAIRKKDEVKLKEVQKAYRSDKNVQVGWLDAFSAMLWAGVTEDTTTYYKATILFTDKYMWDDGDALNQTAWQFFEKTNNKEYLMKAEAWAKRSVELNSSYANNDTYASILFKLGKYAEAKTAAIKSIEFGKQEKADVKPTEELLEKINEKLKA